VRIQVFFYAANHGFQRGESSLLAFECGGSAIGLQKGSRPLSKYLYSNEKKGGAIIALYFAFLENVLIITNTELIMILAIGLQHP
jgi:hypothetical protein